MAIEYTSQKDIGHSQIFLRSDGIVQVNATDHSYSVEDIKTIHKAVNEIIGNKKTLLLLVGSKFTSVEAEARHFLATPEAGVHSIAEAYVIKSLAQRLILNFLIKVQGTAAPAKFFTEMDTAIKWLIEFKSANNNRSDA